MIDVPSPEETARRQIRGIIESYILEYEDEDNLNRVMGTLRSHDPQLVGEVIDAYWASWKANPDVDKERLEDIRNQIQDSP